MIGNEMQPIEKKNQIIIKVKKYQTAVWFQEN